MSTDELHKQCALWSHPARCMERKQQVDPIGIVVKSMTSKLPEPSQRAQRSAIGSQLCQYGTLFLWVPAYRLLVIGFMRRYALTGTCTVS